MPEHGQHYIHGHGKQYIPGHGKLYMPGQCKKYIPGHGKQYTHGHGKQVGKHVKLINKMSCQIYKNKQTNKKEENDYI